MNVTVLVLSVEGYFLRWFSVVGSRTVVHAPASELISFREACWYVCYV